MQPFKQRKLHREWLAAQDIHAKEHAVGIALTLPYEAIGHWDSIDTYSDFYDRDARRKFLAAR